MQQCPKSLWLQVYRPELRSSSDKREHIFESGNQVGFLAQQLFPAGTDVSELTKMNLNKAIEVTSKLISKNAAVIYEATFQYNGVLVMVDILVKTAQGYSIYEVKSGTSVKDVNKTDAAVQYHVLSKCAIPIDKVFVTTLNREYVRKGALNPLDLFIHHDVTDDVIGLQSQVVHLIEDAKSTLTQTEQPTIEIGQHCNKPYECEFKDYCWADHRAADSILTLRYGGDAMVLPRYPSVGPNTRKRGTKS
jgi:predicted RecB family nuclease